MALVLALSLSSTVLAQGRAFSAEELAEFDGKDGRKAYTAFEGKVYDVTDSTLWKLGEHFGLKAGIDLTAKMAEAPHGPEVFAGFTQIGTLEGITAEPTAEVAAPLGDDAMVPASEKTAWSGLAADEAQIAQKPWYTGRIQFLDISILGWTGIVMGVFFVLTFATCFAMPWAKLRLPWTGSKIGSDPLDAAGTHLPWTAIHKYFVWVTVILGIIHGVLGILQIFGVYV